MDMITEWNIDWGDGSPIEMVAGDPSTATHVYADGDSTYTVSATATNEDGTFSSNSISVVVDNIAPTLTVNTSIVLVSEGMTATNGGMLSDVAADEDGVTFTASLGTAVNNMDGTWSWSYPTTDEVGSHDGDDHGR